jgi:hypothetical protein
MRQASDASRSKFASASKLQGRLPSATERLPSSSLYNICSATLPAAARNVTVTAFEPCHLTAATLTDALPVIPLRFAPTVISSSRAIRPHPRFRKIVVCEASYTLVSLFVSGNSSTISPTSQLRHSHIFISTSIRTVSPLESFVITLHEMPVDLCRSCFFISLSINIFHSFYS